MGNKNIHNNRIVETSIPGSGDRWSHTEKRSSQFHGPFIRIGNNGNNNKMGEAFRQLINAIGFTTYLMGIIVNLNNWISIALGAVGVGWGVVKLLHGIEVWLIKRIERKERARKFFYDRSIDESERDEHPPAKK